MTPQQAHERAEETGTDTGYRNQLARQTYQTGPRDAEADMARHWAQAASQVTHGVPHAEVMERRGGPGAAPGSQTRAPATSPAGAPDHQPNQQQKGKQHERQHRRDHDRG
jgi:hypothetical protein